MENEINGIFVFDSRKKGFALVSKEILEDTETIHKGSTLNVYVALCMFANNETGESFPLVNSIGKYARCGRRAVQEALNALEDAGYISRERRFNPDGGRTSNAYKILK